MKNIHYLKSAAVGLLGSLVMFVLMMFAINANIAPFNVPPSAAFLDIIGLHTGPLPLLVHFGYGATWSVVLVFLFRERTGIWNALGLSLSLWLFMMIVYSPIIGWGFFGFGSAGELAKDATLYLEPGPKYLIATAILHLIYGSLLGGLNPLWLSFEERSRNTSPGNLSESGAEA